ncbi:uncharacterized protein TRIADDRAFT_52674 [Trichoplax adhaerens]|uniref:Protein arginine methyltransferase NDUFAF7 n=1 Tax=Trichoplax adhaerens TaxID=10228 RepID=B3RJT8_TRIAD|nr:hypothetical protein TRIADDRAFT_52674 [Trichoplax adhaerens]EDV29842.1 hypothetical protein TRIADDRAFT_52674 [Trichoplax adhaerens]|eukprot:XP_002109044.1 hypothetical protein TRIADDRAFT_52674 [Trichoplax adhaerens]
MLQERCWSQGFHLACVKWINSCRYIERLYGTYPVKSEKTPLVKDLISQIKADGPISIASYMRQVLTGPMGGYYMSSDVFGSKGDFTTSPEVNQMFGELIGIWLYYQWMQTRPKSHAQIIELGPGRGTLSADILRTIKQFRNLQEGLSLHLVEISPKLSKIQEDTICMHDTKTTQSVKELDVKPAGCYKALMSSDGIPIYWYYHLKDVPNNDYSLVVANEFFDALPIHQFRKVNGNWNEVMIDVDEGDGKHHLKFVLAPKPTLQTKLYTQDVMFAKSSKVKDIMEVSPDSATIYKEIADRLRVHGGCALIVDYGEFGTGTDTIRAFRKHKQVHVLDAPGSADLTADVDFAFLKYTVENTVKFYGPIPQGQFLLQMGIQARLKMLIKELEKSQRDDLLSAYYMLINPNKMGLRFKVACMVYPGLGDPPGFGASTSI